MQGTFGTGAIAGRLIYRDMGFLAAEVQQTVTPSVFAVRAGTARLLTTNLPAGWTSTSGSLVVAGDGLSATFTAPGATGRGTITVTNDNDPGDTATATYVVYPASGGKGGRGQTVRPGVPSAEMSVVG